jgi:hypothetical protein
MQAINLKVERPGIQAKLITHQIDVKSAVEMLRAKIELQIYIIEKCKFRVYSQILNWANKACFREELPLRNLGSKILSTSESCFC